MHSFADGHNVSGCDFPHSFPCPVTHHICSRDDTLMRIEAQAMPHVAPSRRWSCPSAILVATNLNDRDHLVPFAIAYARASSARLILLHVLSSSGRVAVDAAGMPYYDPSLAVDFAVKTLEPWRAMAHRENLTCDLLVREGSPSRQVADAVRQFNIDCGRFERRCCAARHHSQRDLKSECGTCLPDRCNPETQACPAARSAAGRRDGA